MASSARIEELKKKFDENPRRYFAPLANEFRKLGDFDQAILICQEFLPQQPGHMSGHIVYGQALFEARRLEDARGVFETALTLDPENLIALRHLGDISRDGGDLDGARYWYRRVLEADPRNEEIASLLAGLDEPAAVTWTTSTPTSSPTVEQAPSTVASWLTDGPVTREEPVVEQPLETIPPQTEVVDFAQVLASSAAPAPTPQPAATESDLIELEATDFPSATPSRIDEGIASLGIERAQETPFGFEPSAFTSGKSGFPDSAPLAGLESTSPASEPAESARLVQDSMSALELPPLDDSFGGSAPPPARVPEPRQAAPEPTSAKDTVFESFEMPIPASETSTASLAQAAAAAESEATDKGSSIDDGIIDEPIEVPPAPLPVAAAAAPRSSQPVSPPPSSGGFVTETMAELYVTQGHVTEAIGVYQQLVGRYPGDEVLRARLVELQSMIAAQEEKAATSPPPVPEASVKAEAVATFEMVEEPLTEATSPFDGAVRDEELESAHWGATASGVDASRIHTIRDFLTELVAYRPNAAPTASPNGVEPESYSESEGEPEGEADTEPEPATQASEDPLADAWLTEEEPETGAWVEEPSTIQEPEPIDELEAPTRESQPFAVSGGSGVGGSIDALFSGTSASATDEEAASLLARAFQATDDDSAISGKPTRAAKDELSLDHVFRDRQANADRGQPTFSFDQFFSQEASDRGSPANGEPSSGTGGQDEDIQQFNAWLEGLKKT